MDWEAYQLGLDHGDRVHVWTKQRLQEFDTRRSRHGDEQNHIEAILQNIAQGWGIQFVA